MAAFHPIRIVLAAGAVTGQIIVPALPSVPQGAPPNVLGLYISASATATWRLFFGDVVAPAPEDLALVWAGDAQYRSIPCIPVPLDVGGGTLALRVDKSAGPTATLWCGWIFANDGDC